MRTSSTGATHLQMAKRIIWSSSNNPAFEDNNFVVIALWIVKAVNLAASEAAKNAASEALLTPALPGSNSS